MTAKKFTKERHARAKFLFWLLNLLLVWCPRCRGLRRIKVPNRDFKQRERWRPGRQKWQPEIDILSLSVLWLDKFVQRELKRRHSNALCETKVFHQVRHRTSGCYSWRPGRQRNCWPVPFLISFAAPFLHSQTTSLAKQETSFLSLVKVWRSFTLEHHIIYQLIKQSQRLNFIVKWNIKLSSHLTFIKNFNSFGRDKEHME